MGSSYNTVVEQQLCNQKIVGSIPTGCWAFSLLYLSLFATQCVSAKLLEKRTLDIAAWDKTGLIWQKHLEISCVVVYTYVTFYKSVIDVKLCISRFLSIEVLVRHLKQSVVVLEQIAAVLLDLESLHLNYRIYLKEKVT